METRRTKSSANAVNAAVYLLRPAKPSSTPVIIQSTNVNSSFLSQRRAISMRPRLSGVRMVSGNNPIASILGTGAAITAKIAMNPHAGADGRMLVKYPELRPCIKW